MLKKIITLFQLGRKVARSDILTIVSKFQEPPLAVRLLFRFLSFSFFTKKETNINQDELIDLMKKNNFQKCTYRNLSGGIVSIHSGWKI